MKQTATILALVLCVTMAACAKRTAPTVESLPESPVSEPQREEPAVEALEEASAQEPAEEASAEESSAEPEEPAPETLPAEPLPENPASAVGEDRTLIAPQFDPFPLQYPFVTAQVGSGDIVRVDLVQSPGGERRSLTERAQIDALWELMERTAITASGADETNPSTGGNLTLEFAFADSGAAKVSMALLVWLGEDGPYLFVDESDEQLYWDLTR